MKAGFFANNTRVPETARKEAGVILENYCARKIREGDDRFVNEVMEIYRFETEHTMYVSGQNISPVYYLNIAIVGAESKQLEWTEKFVEEYKKYLPDYAREDTHAFCRAHVLFGMKKYNEALRYALTCKVTPFMTNILIRNLVARLHYELNMLDELQIELYALRHNVKDQKLKDERRAYFESFVKELRQLAELKANNDRAGIREFRNHIVSVKNFVHKNWLLKKIDEFGKGE